MTARGAILQKSRTKNVQIFRGYLAENYDGIGQTVLVALARASTSAALKAQISSGDFGTGATYTVGMPVLVISEHGKLSVVSLGSR